MALIQNVSLHIDALEQAGAMSDALENGARELRDQVAALAGLPMPLLTSAIWDGLRRAVDFDLFDWLAEAWIAIDQVRTLAAEEGPVYQPLKTWPITAELHPVVTITVAGVSHDLPFTITLIAEFDTVILTIDRGYITEFKAANCSIKGGFAFRQHELLDPVLVKSFDIPFKHVLKEPGLRL